MTRLRAAAWSLAIGVLGVVLAALLFRLVRAPGAFFVVLLIWCAGLVAMAAALIVEISPAVGAGGGVFGALLVAAVLGLTIAAAPLAPGAHRPGLADLLWTPLIAVLAVVALCGVSGWYGVRAGRWFTRRRTTPPG